MRHSFITIISVAAAAAALVSCAKEADLKNQIEPEVKGFKVNVLAGDESKTYVEDGTVPVVKWSASDKIVLIESMDGAVQGTGISNAASISSDLAQFSTTIDWDATGGSSYTYSAVYPADAFISYNSKYYLYMPSVQTLEGNNLSSDSDILFSVVEDRGATRVADGEDLMFSFRRLGTVVRLTLKGITAGEKINRVVITAPKYIAGAIEYDPVTSTVDPSTAFVDAASDEITLNVDELTATGEDVVWFRVLAESDWAAGDAVTFKVITDKNIYKKEIAALPKAMKFPDGGLTKFSVDLSGSAVAPLSVPYSESFEGSVDDWTFIDADGDGYIWNATYAPSYANTGNNSLVSYSWYSNNALTPDNWAFTPQIQLTTDNYLSFWVSVYNISWPAEHYAVYIVEGTPAGNNMDILMAETEYPNGSYSEVNGNYQHFSIQIPSKYDGKTVCIGFRHFNCTDQYALIIDDVEVVEGDPFGPFDAKYEDYLGDWAVNKDKITISEKVNGVSYYISGLSEQGSYSVEAAFEDGRLVLYEQLVASSGTTEVTEVFLQGSDGYFPSYPGSSPLSIFKAEYDKVNNKIDIVSLYSYYMFTTYTDGTRSSYTYSTLPIFLTVYVPDVTVYLYEEDFETDNTASWIFIDADGDGENWKYVDDGTYKAYSGDGILTSASFDNSIGALTPDNWAFTPATTLTSDNYLSFWVGAQDTSWPEEHYAVYIIDKEPTAGNLDDCVVLLAEQVFPNGSYAQVSSDGLFQRYVIPIPSSFNGKTVYIGFRHFNCTDQFWLNIDDVAISEGNPVSTSPNPAPAKPRTIAASKTSQFNLWTPSLKGKAPQSRISIENTARKVR